MKILRLAAIAVLALGVLLGAAAAIFRANQDRVTGYVLDAVRARTQLEISARAIRLRVGSHLIVELEQPRIARNGRELARLRRLRAVVSIHSILFDGGMPLRALFLEQPDLTLPETPAALMPSQPPGPEAVAAVLDKLADLRRVAWRMEATDATIRDGQGRLLIQHANLRAYRRHFDPRLWLIKVDGTIATAPMSGMEIDVGLRAGASRHFAHHDVCRGRIRLSGMPVGLVQGPGWRASGAGDGGLTFAIKDDGSARGWGDFEVGQLGLSGSALSAPQTIGDYHFRAQFAASADSVTLGQAALIRGNTTVASGDIELTHPLGANPGVSLHLTGITIDAGAVKPRLRAVRGLPAYVISLLDRTTAGALVIAKANVTSTIDELKRAPLNLLRERAEVVATVRGAGFTLPADLKIPAVAEMNVQLRYADGVLTAAQGTAQVGGSPISDVTARLDFTRGFARVPYAVSFAADADFGELFPAAMHVMDRLDVKDRDRIESVKGRLSIAARASGAVLADRYQSPDDFNVRIDANRFQVKVKRTPGPVQLSRGTITFGPRLVKIDRVAVTATGGDAIIDGDLAIDSDGLKVRELTVELHQMPGGLWVPLVVDPNVLSIDGPVGGKVVIRSDPQRPGEYLPDGKLVMARGNIQFGFLRSPMVYDGATVTFDRHSAALAMPSTKLEGQPLDFKLSIADLRRPVFRIDTVAQQLDLEVMKFIRTPWSPATPPVAFPVPVRGHIEVRRGNLDRLELREAKCDFTYDRGDWHVSNMTARSLSGDMALDLTGRRKDDWVHIKGTLGGAQIGRVFELSDPSRQPPIVGRLTVIADVWADTNTDFFTTLGGSAALSLHDGTLKRMTLLSRMLNLIDLKTWLTAKLPDPTVSGLPFKTVVADFKGDTGVFYTDNFRLDGPVMDITATGSVQVGGDNLDLQVAMFPFQTVNWVLNKIPFIGQNVAGGTDSILAGYFQVSGPVSDPHITPKPITSVAELIKKTIGLPINILRPDTIK
ncbi:MAG TPA: AsmA-like C-terminal domain-containing protein [Candidatus Binataceae bacterium]|nr:AsmA-like C-terminal domain-containing protein [Candidatus Binataceae bacterium]